MEKKQQNSTEVSDRIFTVPNLISFIRICMVPVFLVLLVKGYDVLAAVVFGVAAATDFVDGKIARAFNQVSKLGQLLDPAVDRCLMISGVCGLAFVGRLPLWIIIVVILRDLLLLIGGAILLKRYRARVPVIYLGKVATTFFFFGFALLLLNWPICTGLGICDFAWLPGLCAGEYCGAIWLVYIALILGAITTVHYVVSGVRAMRAEHDDECGEYDA